MMTLLSFAAAAAAGFDKTCYRHDRSTGRACVRALYVLLSTMNLKSPPASDQLFSVSVADASAVM